MHPPVPLRSWTLAAAAVALVSASAAAAEAPECKRILLADGAPCVFWRQIAFMDLRELLALDLFLSGRLTVTYPGVHAIV